MDADAPGTARLRRVAEGLAERARHRGTEPPVLPGPVPLVRAGGGGGRFPDGRAAGSAARRACDPAGDPAHVRVVPEGEGAGRGGVVRRGADPGHPGERRLRDRRFLLPRRVAEPVLRHPEHRSHQAPVQPADATRSPQLLRVPIPRGDRRSRRPAGVVRPDAVRERGTVRLPGRLREPHSRREPRGLLHRQSRTPPLLLHTRPTLLFRGSRGARAFPRVRPLPLHRGGKHSRRAGGRPRSRTARQGLREPARRLQPREQRHRPETDRQLLHAADRRGLHGGGGARRGAGEEGGAGGGRAGLVDRPAPLPARPRRRLRRRRGPLRAGRARGLDRRRRRPHGARSRRRFRGLPDGRPAQTHAGAPPARPRQRAVGKAPEAARLRPRRLGLRRTGQGRPGHRVDGGQRGLRAVPRLGLRTETLPDPEHPVRGGPPAHRLPDRQVARVHHPGDRAEPDRGAECELRDPAAPEPGDAVPRRRLAQDDPERRADAGRERGGRRSRVQVGPQPGAALPRRRADGEVGVHVSKPGVAGRPRGGAEGGGLRGGRRRQRGGLGPLRPELPGGLVRSRLHVPPPRGFRCHLGESALCGIPEFDGRQGRQEGLRRPGGVGLGGAGFPAAATCWSISTRGPPGC